MVNEILLTGAENAQSSKEICGLLHIHKRELGLAVERERRQGYPICASTDNTNPGYFLAANKDEMQRFCDSLKHRAGEIHKTRRACIKSMENLPL
jgi:hypothetical protein